MLAEVYHHVIDGFSWLIAICKRGANISFKLNKEKKKKTGVCTFQTHLGGASALHKGATRCQTEPVPHERVYLTCRISSPMPIFGASIKPSLIGFFCLPLQQSI